MRPAFSFPVPPTLRHQSLRRPTMSLPRPSAPAQPPLKTVLHRSSSPSSLAAAAAALASGSLVAFPTESVYGLGANALLHPAVLSIFSAKSRPPDNPLIVHLPSLSAVLASNLTPTPLGSHAAALAEAFWPGPLTLVLPLSPNTPLSPAVSNNLPSIAFRVPSHPVATALLEAAAVPVAAPSANRSGRPSPTSPAHVLNDLSGRIHAVVTDDGIASASADGTGPVSVACGLESTVVDLTDEAAPAILRPGAVSRAELERVCGVPFVDGGSERACGAPEAPKAPGMKYRHYAPRAPVVLVSAGELADEVRRRRGEGAVGLLADEETCVEMRDEGLVCVACGVRGDVSSFARGLYAGLRAFDGESNVRGDVEVIVVVTPEDVGDGIGAAVMNRLRKAANAAGEDVVAAVA